MPHKKNPISAENLTGGARLLRSYAQAAMENIALWHERDISHSSVERVIFPDAFILLDYMIHRMAGVLERLYVDKDRMMANMQNSGGQLFSSHVLLEMVEAGLSREEAYALVQRASHRLKPGDHLKQALLEDPESMKHLKKDALDEIFSGRRHQRAIDRIFEQALESMSS